MASTLSVLEYLHFFVHAQAVPFETLRFLARSTVFLVKGAFTLENLLVMNLTPLLQTHSQSIAFLVYRQLAPISACETNTPDPLSSLTWPCASPFNPVIRVYQLL